MTCLCKLGLGSRGLTRVAMGTVSGSNSLAVAVQMRACRRQHGRTRCSTVSFKQEGRASRALAKTNTAPHPKSICGVASSVLQRSHAGKAIQGNSRDPMSSRIVNRRLLCLLILVAETISVSEGSGDALWGVGEAHSIVEGGDSITPLERRSLACMHDYSEFKNESIPVGGRRFSFE
jgi:hypothetical protein